MPRRFTFKKDTRQSGRQSGHYLGSVGTRAKSSGGMPYSGDCPTCGHRFKKDEDRYMTYAGGEKRVCTECARKRPDAIIYPAGERDKNWRDSFDQRSDDPKHKWDYMPATNDVEAEKQ